MANIKDKALYFVGNKLLKYVYKNPQKNMLKLVKLGKAVAGKMFKLPNNISICSDCMHKTMNTMNQFDYTEALKNFSSIAELINARTVVFWSNAFCFKAVNLCS